MTETYERDIDEQTSVTPTATEERSDVVDTTVCDGLCEQVVYEAGTVDVVVGAITGRSDRPERTVTVTGADVGSPEHEHWCLDCARREFDVERAAGERSLEETNTYLTPSNIVSLIVGFGFALLVATMFVV